MISVLSVFLLVSVSTVVSFHSSWESLEYSEEGALFELELEFEFELLDVSEIFAQLTLVISIAKMSINNDNLITDLFIEYIKTS